MDLDLPSNDETFDEDLPAAPEGCRTVKATEGASYNAVISDGKGGMRFLHATPASQLTGNTGEGVATEIGEVDPEILRELREASDRITQGPAVIVRKR